MESNETKIKDLNNNNFSILLLLYFIFVYIFCGQHFCFNFIVRFSIVSSAVPPGVTSTFRKSLQLVYFGGVLCKNEVIADEMS
jgi:hypothetical protein